MPDNILEGVEQQPPKVQTALMIASIRSLDDRMRSFTKAAWWVAGALFVFGLGLLSTVISGALLR